MSILQRNKLKNLLKSKNTGGLLFSSYLKENGYSNQLLKNYRDSGWLTTLSKGVMYHTGDTLKSFQVLSSYNEQLKKNFHIAALSALELFGYNHYVPMGKAVLMVFHPKEQTVPEWMKEDHFDNTLKFFSSDSFPQPQLHTFNNDCPYLMVSSPEQAFLECLLLTPKYYSYIDLYYIMEQLNTLRPKVLQILLENISNIKAKRMFLYMAEKAGHYWFKTLDKDNIDLGTSTYQLAEDGVYISKYKITIQKELYEYE